MTPNTPHHTIPTKANKIVFLTTVKRHKASTFLTSPCTVVKSCQSLVCYPPPSEQHQNDHQTVLSSACDIKSKRHTLWLSVSGGMAGTLARHLRNATCSVQQLGPKRFVVLDLIWAGLAKTHFSGKWQVALVCWCNGER